MADTAPPWMPPDAPPGDGSIDPRVYLRPFRRWWWLAVFILCFIVGGAVAVTAVQPRIYEGSARLFVGQQTIPRQDIQFAQGLTQTSLALVKSYSEAIKTRPIAQRVVRELSLPQGADSLLGDLTAQPVQDTQIIRIAYRHTDPERARDVANAFANTFIASLALIDPAGEGSPAVQVSVLEPAATPDDPVSPQPVRNAALALVLGAALAWGAVLLAERFDATVKGRLDAEEASGAPVLGLIPHIKVAKGHLLYAPESIAGEAYRALRASIEYLWAEGQLRTILVTSPEVGDGKTTTAFNLATSFAERGVETVYVEADLRRPAIARHLNVAANRGLSTVLGGSTSMPRVAFATWLDHLSVVAAGPQPDNPAELLGRPRMDEFLKVLGDRGGLVIVDSPPVLAVSDPIALASKVDGVLVVVRCAKTRREHIQETLRVLRGVGAPIVGVAVTDLRKTHAYGYGYGYGYGYSAYQRPSRDGSAPADEDETIVAMRQRRLGRE